MARRKSTVTENTETAVETDKKVRAPRQITPFEVVLRVTDENGNPVEGYTVDILQVSRDPVKVAKTLMTNMRSGGLYHTSFLPS